MAPPKVDPWPELPFGAWRSTHDTLHMCTQMVGKTLLAAAPPQNHWWHVTLRVSSRGLASQPIPFDGRTIDLEFDLLDHVLVLRTSDGGRKAIPLAPRTVRSFYEEYVAALSALGVGAHIWTRPVEVADPIPFERDEVHRDYDREWVRRFFEVLRRCDLVLRGLAWSFLGKQSPSHFFWGGFDLAQTRFSGRRAPERPGADAMTREGYSHEVISFGFWPGGAAANGMVVDEPIIYAYAAPEPEGFRAAKVIPSAARYDERLGEFLLPYHEARKAADPAAAIRDFCESVYRAGATLGRWDRASLERG
jgi:hypothetical protein